MLEHANGSGTIQMGIAAFASQVDLLGHAPQRFGPYRVVRRLGQGGQGAVFEGIRDDQTFTQRVAIKVVKWEMDDDSARARFRQERQILAGLEHPNIARLMDGGETQEGTPYLVMEFVEGRPVTTATEGWPLKRKLQMFLEILDAVGYAHRNLVVHRDLKPANILVTSEGRPKLLDFGIAKLVDASGQRTQTAALALTPDYASPEQVRGLPISTASDVYSLGVVLYELLTSRRPYKLDTVTPLEMDRVVCQLAPPAPQLGDELDDIVMMALRKEPERRYGGAAQLAEDIERYLDQRPVSARPDTLTYRTRKYVARHWVALLAAAISLLAVTGGAVVALYQAHVAEQRFNQVRKLAHSFVFDYHDELAKLEGSTALREKMVHTALEYVDSLAQSAGNDLGLQAELAAAYRKLGDAQGFPAKPNLGHVDQAIVSYRKAAPIYNRLAESAPHFRREAGEFYTAYTSLLTNVGNYDEAAKTGQMALRNASVFALANPNDEAAQISLARVWNQLGDIDDEKEVPAEALKKYQRSESIATAVLGRWQNEMARQAVENAEDRVGPEAAALGQLQAAATGLQRDDQAVAELLRVAPRNPAYLSAQTLVMQFWSQLYDDDSFPSFEDPDRALPYCRQMVERARDRVSKDPHNAAAVHTLAIALYRLSFPLRQRDPKAAVEAARESVGLFDAQIAAGRTGFQVTSRRTRARLRLSEALVAAGMAKEGRAAGAEAYVEERAMAARDNPKAPVSTRMVLALLACGRASDLLGERRDAEDSFEQARQVADQIYARGRNVLIFVIPKAHVQKALAEHSGRWHDRQKAARELDDLARVWQAFPDQNEYVARQCALLNRLRTQGLRDDR